jgi:hypothetical protein
LKRQKLDKIKEKHPKKKKKFTVAKFFDDECEEGDDDSDGGDSDEEGGTQRKAKGIHLLLFGVIAMHRERGLHGRAVEEEDQSH